MLAKGYSSNSYPESICIIYSPRKFFGVPDGGVLATSSIDAYAANR
jgi:hypothetical protein